MTSQLDTRARRTAAALAGIVLALGIVAAQSAPSLAGTWVLDREKTAALSPAGGAGGQGAGARSSGAGASVGAVSGGGGGVASFGGGGGVGGGGGRMSGGATPEWTIAQTAATLTITRVLPDGTTQTLVHKLDGSESVNVNGRTTFTSRTTVSGGKFTTSGTQVVKTDQGDVTSSLKEVRWIDKDGSLVVETTRTVDGSSRASTSVLVRKTT
jgi:hypothetical protein